MAFSVKSKKNGTEYFLHGRAAANGKTKLYFFSKEVKDGAMDALPEAYEVSENSLTGLPQVAACLSALIRRRRAVLAPRTSPAAASCQTTRSKPLVPDQRRQVPCSTR